jgi:hypothetical protein
VFAWSFAADAMSPPMPLAASPTSADTVLASAATVSFSFASALSGADQWRVVARRGSGVGIFSRPLHVVACGQSWIRVLLVRPPCPFRRPSSPYLLWQIRTKYRDFPSKTGGSTAVDRFAGIRISSALSRQQSNSSLNAHHEHISSRALRR